MKCLVLVILWMVAQASGLTCRQDYKLYNGVCYKFYHDLYSVNFYGAQEKCRYNGEQLAEINNEQEMKFMGEMWNIERALVGIQFEEGSWRRISGGKVRYLPWGDDQPNESKGDCVVLQYGKYYNWNCQTISCNYICMYQLPTTTSPTTTTTKTTTTTTTPTTTTTTPTTTTTTPTTTTTTPTTTTPTTTTTKPPTTTTRPPTTPNKPPPSITQQPDCDDFVCDLGWTKTKDRCYKVITGLPVTRRQADRECDHKHQAMQEMVGGDEAFLIDLAGAGSYPWSGMMSADGKGGRRSTGCDQLITNGLAPVGRDLRQKVDCESTTTRFVCLRPRKCSLGTSTTGTPPTTTSLDPSMDSGWVKFKNHYYKYVNGPEINMTEAEAMCLKDKSHLLSLESKEEAEFVVNLAREPLYSKDDMSTYFFQPWIGLRHTGTKYTWTDPAVKEGYLPWSSDEPQRETTGEMCVRLVVDEYNLEVWDGKWGINDWYCHTTSRRYVCKKECENKGN